jgi:hypothetical protein
MVKKDAKTARSWHANRAQISPARGIATSKAASRQGCVTIPEGAGRLNRRRNSRQRLYVASSLSYSRLVESCRIFHPLDSPSPLRPLNKDSPVDVIANLDYFDIVVRSIINPEAVFFIILVPTEEIECAGILVSLVLLDLVKPIRQHRVSMEPQFWL